MVAMETAMFVTKWTVLLGFACIQQRFNNANSAKSRDVAASMHPRHS